VPKWAICVLVCKKGETPEGTKIIGETLLEPFLTLQHRTKPKSKIIREPNILKEKSLKKCAKYENFGKNARP